MVHISRAIGHEQLVCLYIYFNLIIYILKDVYHYNKPSFKFPNIIIFFFLKRG